MRTHPGHRFTVVVESLSVYGHHGVGQQERLDGQEFLVDISAVCEVGDPLADELAHCVDYAALARLFVEINQEHAYFTLEALMAEFAQRVWEHFPNVEEMSVWIRKPAAPVEFGVASLGVRVHWARPGLEEA